MNRRPPDLLIAHFLYCTLQLGAIITILWCESFVSRKQAKNLRQHLRMEI